MEQQTAYGVVKGRPPGRASFLVVYEPGYLSALEIFRFGLWMTLVAYRVVLSVALPYWAAVGEPLLLRPVE